MARFDLLAAVLLLLSVGGQVSRTTAQSVSVAELQSYIDEDAPPFPLGLHIRWQTEEHAILTRDELDRLKAEIAGKPDHPRRQEAINEEWRLAHGPSTLTRDVYTGPDGQLRFGEQFPSGSTTDVGFGNGVVWSVSISDRGEASALLLKEGVDPPPGRNVLPYRDIAERQIAQFTRGALSFLTGIPSPRVTSVSLAPTGWRAQVEFLEGAGRFEFFGHVEATGIRVSSAKLLRLEPAPGEVGTRAAYSEPWSDSPLGPVFRVAEEFTASGRLKFRNRLLLVEPYGGTEAFAIPDEVWHDQLRGSVALTSVTDFRRDPEGRLKTRPSSMESWTTVQAPRTVEQQLLWSLDRIGYFVLGGAVLIVAGVWMLRRRGAL